MSLESFFLMQKKINSKSQKLISIPNGSLQPAYDRGILGKLESCKVKIKECFSLYMISKYPDRYLGAIVEDKIPLVLTPSRNPTRKKISSWKNVYLEYYFISEHKSFRFNPISQGCIRICFHQFGVSINIKTTSITPNYNFLQVYSHRS